MNTEHLYLQKLLRKIEWLKSEILWKESIIENQRQRFLEFCINLAQHDPLLKEKYENYRNTQLRKPEAEKKNSEPSVTIKKLHRNLAKMSHPDLEAEQELFFEAQKCYERNDLAGLVILAQAKNLQVEFDFLDYEKLEAESEQLEHQNKDIEINPIWQWYWSKEPEILVLNWFKELLN